MKKFYFLRHGETGFNRSWRHQFRETPLSEKGHMQARCIAEVLKEKKIDVIISSSLERARQTAQAVHEATGVSVEESELLIELRRPTKLLGVSWFSPVSLFIMGALYFKASEKDYHHSDEENLEEFHARAKRALQYLTKRKEENILVVTHRGFMANLFSRMKHDGLDTLAQYRRALWKNLTIGNCCFHEADWTPEGEWGDTLDGTWVLNETETCPNSRCMHLSTKE